MQVTLEAFNPLIPLDTGQFVHSLCDLPADGPQPGRRPAEVSLFATLQNAVGSQGAGGIQGVRFAGYGGNRNRAVRQAGLVAVAMDKSPDPVASGPVKVRAAQRPGGRRARNCGGWRASAT